MKNRPYSRNFILISLILSSILLYVGLKYFEPKPEVYLKIQFLKKSNLDPVISVKVTKEVKVIRVNNGKLISSRGFLDFGGTSNSNSYRGCGKLTQRSSASIGVILYSGADHGDCSIETQLRQADRAQYSIVLLAGSTNIDSLPRPLLKNNKFHYVSTVGFVSSQDALLIKEHSLPASDRYFVRPVYVKRLGRLEDQIPFLYLYGEDSSFIAVQLFAYIFIFVISILLVTRYIHAGITTSHIKRKRETPLQVPTPKIKNVPPKKQKQNDQNKQKKRRGKERSSGAMRTDNSSHFTPSSGRARKRSENENTNWNTEEEPQPGPSQTHIRIRTETATSEETVIIQSKEYLLHKLIGNGAFGQVWEASLKPKNPGARAKAKAERLVIKKIDFKMDAPESTPLAPPDVPLVEFSGDDDEVNIRLQNHFRELFVHRYRELELDHRRKIMQEDFNREVKILEHLKSSNSVIEILSSETYHACGLILMEAGGQDLQTYLTKTRTTLGSWWEMWIKMVRAVQSVHQIGVAHLDIKLSNFVWVSGNQIKLIDFGNALLIDEDKDKDPNQRFGGTPGFISPEILLGYDAQVGPPSDIWGLGSILYYMLKGEILLGDMDFNPQVEIEQKLDQIHTAIEIIQSESFRLKSNYGNELNMDFIRLLRNCLEFDPISRFRAQQVYSSSRNLWNKMTATTPSRR